MVLTVSASGGAPSLAVRHLGGELRLHPRPLPPAPGTELPDISAYAWRRVGDTGVITLRTFASSTAVRAQLRAFVDGYPEHARLPTLVFDLRDNHGGSLEALRAWLARAVRGEWRSCPWLAIVGALWPCNAWNLAVERQIAEGTVDDPEAREKRERLRAAWGDAPPPPPSQLGLGIQRGRATEPYASQVFVLLNRNAGSSGELAAHDLKRALGAILVGERSAGTLQYGEVRRFVLPATGLVCQVPTRRFFFDEPVEVVGLPVDAYLERIDQDAAALLPNLDRLRAAIVAPRH